MRQRCFEIIRTPELEGSSFLWNNVLVSYVGTNPETGISFYCNNGEGSVLGVSVYPNGRKVQVNATTNKKGYEYQHGKDEYLQFRHAFGGGKSILASHAVWMAAGRTIPAGMTIDHINGCTTDNYIGNLRCVSMEINYRDGGFLRMLRNNGFFTSRIDRAYLLRYYDRMAYIKDHINRYRYKKLTEKQLRAILYMPDEELQIDSLIQTIKTRKNYAKRH